jgi:SnoaL-like domain
MSRGAECLGCSSNADPQNVHHSTVPLGRRNYRVTFEATTLLPACMQVMHQLFYFLDQFRYQDLAGLFLPEGTLLRQGQLLVGRESIVEALSKRSATQRIRHVISNAFIESESPERVQLVAYMLAYHFDNGVLPTGPADISRPYRMSTVRAAMCQSGGAWSIAEMTFRTEFNFLSDTARP